MMLEYGLLGLIDSSIDLGVGVDDNQQERMLLARTVERQVCG